MIIQIIFIKGLACIYCQAVGVQNDLLLVIVIEGLLQESLIILTLADDRLGLRLHF